MMKGARRPVRAVNQAPKATPMLANMFDGTVINCALQVANPKLVMIVGMKRLKV